VERKHWGLLLLCKVIGEAPADVWGFIFSKSAVQCLINALKGDDRYLQRTTKKVIQALHLRLTKEPKLKHDCLNGLLEGSAFVDFDNITKTKTFEKLLTPEDWSSPGPIQSSLFGYLRQPRTTDPVEAHRRRKVIVNLQSKAFELHLSRPLQEYDPSNEASDLSISTPSQILERWIDVLYFGNMKWLAPIPEIQEETRNYMKERLAASFEHSLKSGLVGRRLLRQTLVQIRYREVQGERRTVEFDEAVEETVRKAWNRLQKIPTSWVWRETEHNTRERKSDYKSPDSGERVRQESAADFVPSARMSGTAFDDGRTMLYCLTLFQVYNGEAEAVEILEDLLTYHERLDHNTKVTSANDVDGSDALIEILLSFASKPSKFQRRLTLQVFETLMPQITSRGLQSLTRILATKENIQGQQEMFEAADVDGDIDEDEASDSDVEMVGSDVESVSELESTISGSDDSKDDEDDEDEIAEFEAKLAEALGTRKGEEDLQADDTSGESDSDMSDDQMMALDDKLAEVFRTRRQAPDKKKEQRDAKETIVHFKNRVLDFVEVYLKHEHLSPQSLGLILPLLKLARQTNTKQLADRACTILRDFCSKCKGQNVPALRITKDDGLDETIEMLKAVHVEAGLEGSNARAAACSSASILLVKTLINGGVGLRVVIDVYSHSREKQLSDKQCKIQPAFFTEWNNWCTQARNQLAK
jgi:DNA polymerase phi